MRFDVHARKFHSFGSGQLLHILSRFGAESLLPHETPFSSDRAAAYYSAMNFSIMTAMDDASGLETWTAAYEYIMRALGFDEDDPAYLAEAMAGTAIDNDIVGNWNKANPAQRQWMVTQIVSHEVKDSYDRRLAASENMVERLKEHVKRQKGL